MPNTYISSDFHLNHANIAGPKTSSWSGGYRDFDSVEEMNETILDNLKVIKPEDTLFFLGDFLFGPDKLVNFEKFWARINVKNKIFLIGNHSRDWMFKHNYLEQVEKVVGKTYDLWEGKVNGQYMVLCHYPLLVWNHCSKGSWMLHGHSHGNLPDDKNCLRIDCGIDVELYGHKKYTPFHFDEIKYIMNTHKIIGKLDHH